MDDQSTNREGGGGVNEELRRFLGDARNTIGELDLWADAKIASGVPASPAEVELLEKVRATLKDLKQRLREIKEGNSFPTT